MFRKDGRTDCVEYILFFVFHQLTKPAWAQPRPIVPLQEVYSYEGPRRPGPWKEISMIKVRDPIAFTRLTAKSRREVSTMVTEEPAIDIVAEQDAELLLVDVKK